MLDIKFVRANQAAVEEALAKRGGKISLDGFIKLEAERRAVLADVENKRPAATPSVKRSAKSSKRGARPPKSWPKCAL